MTEPYIPQTPPTEAEIFEAEKDKLVPFQTYAEAEAKAAEMEQVLKEDNGGNNE